MTESKEGDGLTPSVGATVLGERCLVGGGSLGGAEGSGNEDKGLGEHLGLCNVVKAPALDQEG